ncbi:MAG: hypothetical protein QOD06_2975 [Candidatus Binatota bacterium]|jgi:SAM-dependent methyltransferase|nr:hypothetical protein [Candidatus Binatota bacterium]
MTGDAPERALALFDKSVLKQAKYRALVRFVGDVDGKTCLDLGSDNGVLSLLLRRRGGRWSSADLAEKAVEAIRAVVGSDVHRTDGATLPFADGSFDLVVVIDMLEHVRDDAAFVAELARVTRAGGELVLNVPHRKPWSVGRPLRNVLGLTDEWHGHLRPGYDLGEIQSLLDGRFEMVANATYSKVFSEILDVALNWAYARKSGGPGRESEKGTVVSANDLARFEREFRLLSRVYPLLRLFTRLDRLVPARGYALIVKARRL